MKKTHTYPFSRQDIEVLGTNPNVKSITASSIRFTEEFLQKLFEAKKAGIPLAQALRNGGIDPEILGESRIAGLSHSLNVRARKGTDFSDGRSTNYRRPPKTGEETVEQRVRQLEHELAYTRQEVEFLKKIQQANMEAQKEWESRHRQK